MPKQLPHVIKDYATEKGVPICLHENRFFRMMFNGYFHYLDAVRYAQGAVILPMFANGDVLLVSLRRAPVVGMSLEFPRGGLNAGETTSEGAAREMREETGFTVAPESAIYLGEVAPDSATLNSLMPVFWVQIPEDAVQGEFDREEIDRPVRMSSAEFRKLILDGTIRDGMTLAAWAFVQERLRAN